MANLTIPGTNILIHKTSSMGKSEALPTTIYRYEDATLDACSALENVVSRLVRPGLEALQAQSALLTTLSAILLANKAPATAVEIVGRRMASTDSQIDQIKCCRPDMFDPDPEPADALGFGQVAGFGIASQV